MGNLTKLSVDELSATLQVLEKGSVGPWVFDRLRSDETFARRISRLLTNGGIDTTLRDSTFDTWEHSELKVFGGEEWEHFFDIKLTGEQWEVARRFPWDLGDLGNRPFAHGDAHVRDTHFAFFCPDTVMSSYYNERMLTSSNSWPGTPLTVETLERLLVERGSEGAFWPRPRANFPSYVMAGNRLNWLQREGFRDEAIPHSRWYLVPLVNGKEILEPAKYEPLKAVEYLLAFTLFYQKFGHWPLNGAGEEIPSIMANTASLTEDEQPVLAGYDKSISRPPALSVTTLSRYSAFDEERNAPSGLAVTRRLPQ